jgi:cation/acetate symporter
LLGQPAVWTVPLAFIVMIVTSLLTSEAIPPPVELVMLRMHLPEALIRHAYGARPFTRT